MDGVLQAPGAPQEDPTNQFKWGGWSFHYWDDLMNKTMGKIMSGPYDLLLSAGAPMKYLQHTGLTRKMTPLGTHSALYRSM